jgi:phosphopantetheine adenylyltransferase
MERVKALLKEINIPCEDIIELEGVVKVDTDIRYLHFDHIKQLSNSIMFKGLRATEDGTLELQFITL